MAPEKGKGGRVRGFAKKAAEAVTTGSFDKRSILRSEVVESPSGEKFRLEAVETAEIPVEVSWPPSRQMSWTLTASIEPPDPGRAIYTEPFGMEMAETRAKNPDLTIPEGVIPGERKEMREQMSRRVDELSKLIAGGSWAPGRGMPPG